MSKLTNAEKKSETLSFRVYPHEKLTALKLAASSQQSLNQWLHNIFHEYLRQDHQAPQWPEIVLAEIAAVREIVESKSVFFIDEKLAAQTECDGIPDVAQSKKIVIPPSMNGTSLTSVTPETLPPDSDQIVSNYLTASTDKKSTADDNGKSEATGEEKTEICAAELDKQSEIEVIDKWSNEDQATLSAADYLHIPALENEILPAIITSEISASNSPINIALNTLMEEKSNASQSESFFKFMIDLNGDELLDID